jgi:hypothetical protein
LQVSLVLPVSPASSWVLLAWQVPRAWRVWPFAFYDVVRVRLVTSQSE